MATAYESLVLAQPSLIHFYMLQEAGGTSCPDSKGGVGGTYNGSNPASEMQQAGIPAGGKSVQFLGGGASTFVSIGLTTTGGTGESIEAWVFLTAWPAAAQAYLISHATTSSAPYSSIIAITSAGQVHGYGKDTIGGIFDQTSLTTLTLNTWHHLFLSCPSGGTWAYYIDGVVQGTASGGTPLGIATGALSQIAGDSSGGTLLTGKVCYGAIYNSGLSAAAVLSHYNAGMAAAGPTFRPWIYGDQIAELYG